MRSYAGKVAVITGAGSGIGRALALELAARGAVLAVSDVDQATAEQTAQACRAAGATARSWRLDVADRGAVFAHAQDVVDAFGQVHLVVNNAGVALHGLVRELEHEDLRWVMEIDFWGVVHGSQAFLPHLTSSGDGQLANVSSVFGLIAVPRQAAYNAAKFAVRGFTEALQQEVRLEGLPVAVSCIHPGGVATAIARHGRVSASGDKAELERSFARVARTSPEQAARTILRGLERDRPRILVGPDAWVLAALPRLLGARYAALATAAAVRAGGRAGAHQRHSTGGG